MIWVVAVAALTLAVGAPYFYREVAPASFGDWLFCGLLVSAFVMAGGVLASVAAITVGFGFECRPVKTAERQLAAIRDKDVAGGSFFLGTGSIRNDTYYFYYAIENDGALVPGRVNAAGRGVRIYEEGRSDAVLQTFKGEPVSAIAWLLSLPLCLDQRTHSFRVPRGTVRAGYSM